MPRNAVPDIRISVANDQPVRDDRDYVIYWMIAHRRSRWNFGLQRALEHAAELDKPLLVFEALRVGYPWASDRLHSFVLDGMADNAERFGDVGIRYHAYVEPEPGHGRGLLEELVERAALVVTDEFPCFFLPRMVAAAAKKIDVRLELVDGNGLLPLRATESEFTTVYSFRRYLQKNLPDHLGEFPVADPLRGLRDVKSATIARDVLDRWSAVPKPVLDGGAERRKFLASLPIDHDVAPVDSATGGNVAGERVAEEFVAEKLERYGEDRNQPEKSATSGLSPYLHFGHVSAHQVVATLFEREGWSPDDLATTANGKREGWWGTSGPAESFLDELITWRELGYVFCFHRPDDYDRFDSLPPWARKSLVEHADDSREHVYTLEEFEQAKTHDDLWNAAQNQLRREGRIHNYLRMLWGKKILEWTPTPRAALDVLIELNNKYALDGRNPNSYSGIFWTLGRFDRAWGPERDVFGVIRFMSSANTARKVKVKNYIEEYGAQGRLW